MKKVSFYDVNYRNNNNSLYKDIRNDVWNNQDIGITSLFSAHQINKFISWLDLKPNMSILDSCCGNGEILAYVTQKTNSKSYGIDINVHSIKAAKLLIQQKKLPVEFLKTDLKKKLPFLNTSFDAVICIDSIIHFSVDDRLKIFKEWNRILKPGGKLILTDPCIISGVISNDELVQRSIFGNYFFLPPGIQDKLLEKNGFNIINSEDITKENAAIIAHKWWFSREKRRKELELTETEEEINQIQLFLKICDRLYKDKKLTQYAWFCRKNYETSV